MFYNQQRKSDAKFGTLFGASTSAKRPEPIASQRDFIRAHDRVSTVARPLRTASASLAASTSFSFDKGQLSTSNPPLRTTNPAPASRPSHHPPPAFQQRTPAVSPPPKVAVDAELSRTAAASSAAADAATKVTEAAILTLKGLPKGTSAKERLAAKKAVGKAKQAAAKAQKRAKIDAAKLQKAVALAEKKAEVLRAKENKAAKVTLLKARKALKPSQAKAKRLAAVAGTVAAATAKKLMALAKEKQKLEKQKVDAQEAAASAATELQKSVAGIAALEERCRATEKPKKAMKAVIKTISKRPKNAMKARK